MQAYSQNARVASKVAIGGLFAFYLQTGAPVAVMDKLATDTSRIKGLDLQLK